MASKTKEELREEIAVITADRDSERAEKEALQASTQKRAEEAKKLPQFEVLVDGGSRMKIVKACVNGKYYRFQCIWSPTLKSFMSTSKYMSEGDEALNHDDMNWFREQIEKRYSDALDQAQATSDDIPFEVEA